MVDVDVSGCSIDGFYLLCCLPFLIHLDCRCFSTTYPLSSIFSPSFINMSFLTCGRSHSSPHWPTSKRMAHKSIADRPHRCHVRGSLQLLLTYCLFSFYLRIPQCSHPLIQLGGKVQLGGRGWHAWLWIGWLQRKKKEKKEEKGGEESASQGKTAGSGGSRRTKRNAVENSDKECFSVEIYQLRWGGFSNCRPL